jgi:hypothetical protein
MLRSSRFSMTVGDGWTSALEHPGAADVVGDALDGRDTGAHQALPWAAPEPLDLRQPGRRGEPRLVGPPAQFGLTNVTTACVTPEVAPYTCQSPDEFLYWDGIHPTKAVHAILAQKTAPALFH